MKNRRILAIISAIAMLTMGGCGDKDSSSKTSSASSSDSKISSEIENNTESEVEKEDETVAEPEESADIETELTNSGIFDYEMKVNGEVIKLPITTAQLKAMGYEPTEHDKTNGDMTPNTLISFTWEDYNSETDTLLYPGRLINSGTETLDYYDNYGTSDFYFYSIMFSKVDANQNSTCEIAKGITVGVSTPDDVVAAFGEPSTINEYGQYLYYEQPDKKDDAKYYGNVIISFDSETNTIRAIEMEDDVSSWLTLEN